MKKTIRKTVLIRNGIVLLAVWLLIFGIGTLRSAIKLRAALPNILESELKNRVDNLEEQFKDINKDPEVDLYDALNASDEQDVPDREAWPDTKSATVAFAWKFSIKEKTVLALPESFLQTKNWYENGELKSGNLLLYFPDRQCDEKVEQAINDVLTSENYTDGKESNVEVQYITGSDGRLYLKDLFVYNSEGTRIDLYTSASSIFENAAVQTLEVPGVCFKPHEMSIDSNIQTDKEQAALLATIDETAAYAAGCDPEKETFTGGLFTTVWTDSKAVDDSKTLDSMTNQMQLELYRRVTVHPLKAALKQRLSFHVVFFLIFVTLWLLLSLPLSNTVEDELRTIVEGYSSKRNIKEFSKVDEIFRKEKEENESLKMQLRQTQDAVLRRERALAYAKDAEQSRREMSSAIAHELKTPLAILSSYCEALQEDIDASKRGHYLDVLADETKKMNEMVMELLDLSRMEGGKARLNRSKFDLYAMAKKAADRLRPLAQERRINIQTYGAGMANADAERAEQVLLNFLKNAIKYSPDEGTVIVRISGDNGGSIRVKNKGTTIPTEEQAKLWDPFWRSDESRNTEGTGLGLAICKTIIELHGGEYGMRNTEDGVEFFCNFGEGLEKDPFQEKQELPKEEIEKPKMKKQEEKAILEFRIAKNDTTVREVFEKLDLLHGASIKAAIKNGEITVGTMTVQAASMKLLPKQILSWRDCEIHIIMDEDQKRRALLAELYRPNGLRGNSFGYNNSGTRGGK